MARNRQKKKHSIFYPTPKVAFTWVLLAFLGYGVFFLGKKMLYKSGYFVVESVRITGNHYIDQKNIQTFAKIDLNQSMFDVDLANITINLLRNPYIRGVSVTRVLPSTILIDVQEREPVFYLVDKSVYMVDETGKVLKKLPRMPMGKLPIVTGVKLDEFRQDSTALFASLRLVKQIHEVDETLVPLISEINYTKHKSPEFVLVNGAARVKIGKLNHYSRLFLLSQLLNKQPMIDKLATIRTIDLTFADRIIIQNKS